MHEIDDLPWPAFTPDLNPIEKLCAYPQHRVAAELTARNKDELWYKLKKWYSPVRSQVVTRKYCRSLVGSMPARPRA